MELLTLENRKYRGTLTTIYKVMNDLESIDRKDILLKRDREAGYL